MGLLVSPYCHDAVFSTFPHFSFESLSTTIIPLVLFGRKCGNLNGAKSYVLSPTAVLETYWYLLVDRLPHALSILVFKFYLMHTVRRHDTTNTLIENFLLRKKVPLAKGQKAARTFENQGRSVPLSLALLLRRPNVPVVLQSVI